MARRLCPMAFFSPVLPIQIKVAYWLTDLPRAGYGNFVYMPGSHKGQYFDFYDTHDEVPGEKVICPKRGTMTFMHCNTWHRVAPNNTDVVRKNIFLAYCPSWVAKRTGTNAIPIGSPRSTASNALLCEVTIADMRGPSPLPVNFRSFWIGNGF